MNGWMGKLLRVDLTRGQIRKEPIDEDVAFAYVGGRGFTTRYAYEELRPGIDPLGPDNQLVFAQGPACGTLIPGSQRWTVGAKSPLTGFIGDANCGGSFGVGLKYAGWDGVIIEGKSDRPLYLLIDGENICLRDASHLWGKTTVETERTLRAELGDHDIHIATTGTAGDNLVMFATINSDNRKAGRTGMGTVMGAKRLKAIVTKGSEGVRVASRERVEKVSEQVYRIWRRSSSRLKTLREYGSGVYAGKVYNRLGILESRNYREGIFPAYDAVADRLKDEFWLKPRSCFSCPIACGHVYVIPGGPYAGNFGYGLYGSSIWYSARLGNPDPALMCELTARSDQYGIDEANLSGVIGWLMECYERGIVTPKDLGGLKMDWGNAESILEITDMIVHRRGVGDLLANGALKAARAIGRGSEEFVMHVKGMDLDSRDPRGSKSWGLGYAVGSRGADHCRHVIPDLESPIERLVEVGKGRLHKRHEDLRAFQHGLEICLFVCDVEGVVWEELLAEMFTAVTGKGITAEEVLRMGERVINLERAFNVREGLTREDDTLPRRFLKEPLEEGSSKGQTVDIDLMVDEYYEARGWDKSSGFPTRHKLEELDLTCAADELAGLGRLA
jgi:aldehyde:ferredoxin oxidoreductase